MEHEVGSWKVALVNGPSSMIRLHKNLVLRALGLSLGVNRMWTKNNDHAPKSEGADFFNTCPIRAILRKSILIILLSCLGLHFSSLLVKCVQDVTCKSSHNSLFKKKERSNL
jgi:hypothetical protein